MLMGIIMPAVLQGLISPVPELELPGMQFGADLFVISGSDQPAAVWSNNGIGNWFSYGVRTMLASDDGLYLGMANASNLATDLTDGHPEGGWELIRLTTTPWCGLGAELTLVLIPLMWMWRRRRRRDAVHSRLSRKSPSVV
jgi:hypothetical protein